jgi:hypothetical protein
VVVTSVSDSSLGGNARDRFSAAGEEVADPSAATAGGGGSWRGEQPIHTSVGIYIRTTTLKHKLY